MDTQHGAERWRQLPWRPKCASVVLIFGCPSDTSDKGVGSMCEGLQSYVL